jgi:phage terminase small subunit
MAGKGKKAAAIAAGCPEKTASQAASRYEKDPEIMAIIGRRLVLDPEPTNVEPKPERPPKQPKLPAAPNADPDPYIAPPADDPLVFFKGVMNDLEADPKLRLEAAKALAAFTVSKPGEKGKKEQRQEDAEKLSSGRFGQRKPGHLHSVK